MMLRHAAVAVPILALVGCAAAASSPPGVLAADPWVRSTDGAQRPEMTGLFVDLTNPSDEERVLVEADCGTVADRTELHEMVSVDGEMVMREASEGIPIPAGGHEHLAPGGPHVMLMQLARELPAGSEEIECELRLDDGQVIEVLAPVKQFTEEQDTYHTHGD